MAFNLTNLWRKIANVGSYLSPMLAPVRAAKTVSDVVSSGISKDRLGQWVNNFLGWVNDTMNLPAVAIWEVGAYVSPRGSRAESEFKRLADTARWVTDMGQDYRSPEYVAWRVTPFVPAVVAAPYLAPEAAGVWAITAVNNVPVATILDMGNLDKRETAREGYVPVIRSIRETITPIEVTAATRKTEIANALRWWVNAWVNLADPAISSLVSELISEYNSL